MAVHQTRAWIKCKSQVKHVYYLFLSLCYALAPDTFSTCLPLQNEILRANGSCCALLHFTFCVRCVCVCVYMKHYRIPGSTFHCPSFGWLFAMILWECVMLIYSKHRQWIDRTQLPFSLYEMVHKYPMEHRLKCYFQSHARTCTQYI